MRAPLELSVRLPQVLNSVRENEEVEAAEYERVVAQFERSSVWGFTIESVGQAPLTRVKVCLPVAAPAARCGTLNRAPHLLHRSRRLPRKARPKALE